jgi:hypothetical protein
MPSSTTTAQTGGGGGGGAKKRRASPASAVVRIADLPSTSIPQHLDMAKVETGHRFDLVETGVVNKVGPKFVCCTTDGGEVMIARHVFSFCTYSSPDQSTYTLCTSTTGLVTVLHGVGGRLFRAQFVKADGTERTMYGTMKAKVDTVFGRSTVSEQIVVDGAIKYQDRQIDHRTLTEVVFNGVRYVTGTAFMLDKSAGPRPDHVPVALLPDQTVTQPIDVAKVMVGHRFGNVEHGVVTKIDADHVYGKSEGGRYQVARDVFCYDTVSSPDQFTRTVRTSKTALVHVLHSVRDHLFCAVFKKADGTDRTMYAVMKGKVDTIFGRSTVSEQVVDGPKVVYQERQIDHRTLKQVTFRGVRYTA